MWRVVAAAGLLLGMLWSPLSALGFDPAWTSYTPAHTAVTTNPTLGNGTLTGRYKALGGYTYLVEVEYVRGSTGTNGSGDWRFSLPYSTGHISSACWLVFRQNGGASFTTGTGRQRGDATVDVPLTGGFMGPTRPWTWATGDGLYMSCLMDSTAAPYADTEFSDGAPGPPGATGPPGADGAAGPTGPPGEACPTPAASAEADCVVEVSAFTGAALDEIHLVTFTLVIGSGLGLICLAIIAMLGMRR